MKRSIVFFFKLKASETIWPPISCISKSIFFSSKLKKYKLLNFELFICEINVIPRLFFEARSRRVFADLKSIIFFIFVKFEFLDDKTALKSEF